MSTTCLNPVRLVPGPMGPPGNNGTNGTDGVDALSLLTAIFTMPAEGASADATVDDNTWIAPGQIVYLQNAGWMQATALVGTNTVTLLNLKVTATGVYADNVAPGTVIPIASKLSAGGLQGPAGTNGTSGAPTNATYITQTPDGTLTNEQPLSTLATGLVKNTTATGVLSIAADGTDYLSPTTGLANAAIGTTVEAHSAILDALAGVAGAADKVAYFTGATAMAVVSLTAYMRSVLGAADAASARTLLGVVPGYGLLGSISALNLNSATTDTAFTINATRYIIDMITVDNPSVNMTTATLGVFTAAGGGGTTLAADQSLAALTATTKFKNLSLQAITGTDAMTAGTLYARCGTAQGVAATANLYLYGWRIS